MTYSPSPVPQSEKDIPAYLRGEMVKLREAINILTEGIAEEYTAEPTDKWNGRLVLADGTSWNPGSGRGFYRYDESTSSWKFLG